VVTAIGPSEEPIKKGKLVQGERANHVIKGRGKPLVEVLVVFV
jgi:hypothetical protein